MPHDTHAHALSMLKYVCTLQQSSSRGRMDRSWSVALLQQVSYAASAFSFKA